MKSINSDIQSRTKPTSTRSIKLGFQWASLKPPVLCVRERIVILSSLSEAHPVYKQELGKDSRQKRLPEHVNNNDHAFLVSSEHYSEVSGPPSTGLARQSTLPSSRRLRSEKPTQGDRINKSRICQPSPGDHLRSAFCRERKSRHLLRKFPLESE